MTSYLAQDRGDFKVDFFFAFFARAELEARTGGNPSWNTGVNYRDQLANSASSNEVRALYQQAGLNLDKDLDTLEVAPRIKADPGAVGYLNRYISFNGDLNIPVLTMHTTGDRLVVNQDEQAYASVVRSVGDSNLLLLPSAALSQDELERQREARRHVVTLLWASGSVASKCVGDVGERGDAGGASAARAP